MWLVVGDRHARFRSVKTKGVPERETRNPLRQEQTHPENNREVEIVPVPTTQPPPYEVRTLPPPPGQTHERTINPETKSKEREGGSHRRKEGRKGWFLSSSFFLLSFQADPARSGNDEAMRRRRRRRPQLETRFRQKETSHRGSISHESCFSFLDETYSTLLPTL